MLQASEVPISQSALLVIDVQDSFLVGDRWAKRSNFDFEGNLSKLIGLYRANKLPVIFILHSDEDAGFRITDSEVRLMGFLKRRDEEPLIHKQTRNCFTSTLLSAILLERGVRRLLITGIQTEQCCETTARIAADLGYAVDYITECTCTFPIPNWDCAGEELGTADIIERTEYVLRRRFAKIETVKEIESELARTFNAKTSSICTV
jgi:nicotinamidase-related amidase